MIGCIGWVRYMEKQARANCLTLLNVLLPPPIQNIRRQPNIGALCGNNVFIEIR